jgi:hypothetical protein
LEENMKRILLGSEEKQKRVRILSDYYQWSEATGKRSPREYAELMDVDYELLTRCIKWNKLLKKPIVDPPYEKKNTRTMPTLVPISRSASTVSPPAIRISLNRSAIDLTGEVSPSVVHQILTALGALDVL